MQPVTCPLEEILPEDSWLKKWMSIWPTAESPRSFLLFSGMAMLGAALGRRLWLDHDPHRLWPMLNLLLIGPSGVGKSTGMMIGFNLIRALPREFQPQVVSGAATPEKLHDDLHVQPHAVLYASELANFFSRQKYMEGLIPYVTELLDYRPEIERRTKGGGLVVVKEPSVTVVGCSTVDWLQEQLPDSATSGGFLARFLIVSEEHKSQRVALPGKMLTRAQQEELYRRRDEVFNGFVALAAQAPSGPIDFRDYEAANEYAVWYSNHKPVTGHLAPFAARAGEFVLRLSLLNAVARDLSYITRRDVQVAIEMQRYAEKRLQEVVVPYTPAGKLLARVLMAVGTGSRTTAEIARAMRNFATAQETARMLESLVLSGDLERSPNGRYRRTTR